MSLEELITSIHIGEYKDQVEKIRKEKNKNKRSKLKMQLPGFTGSGTFSSRKNSGLIEHNNRIIIDLDDIEDIDDAKSELGADPFVEYVFTSVGGRGLAVIFKIDGSKHEQSFVQIKEYIEKKYGYQVDKGVKDVARLRFVSYDPDLIHNYEADVFEVRSKTDVYDVRRIKHILSTNLAKAPEGQKHFYLVRNSRLAGGFVAGGMIDEAEARDFLRNEIQKRQISNKGVAFKTIDDGLAYGSRTPITAETAAEYEHRHAKKTASIKEIYSFAHHINREGRLWTDHDVENLGELHEIDGSEIKRIFKQVFDENKHEHGIANKPEIEKVEVFLNRNYDFVLNEVTQVREMRKSGDSDYSKINYDTIYRLLQKRGFKFSLEKLKSLLRSDFVPVYNPFETYFASLPSWKEGKDPDYIDELAKHVKTTTPEFWRIQFKKALVRQIACALDSYVNRIVVVLVSEKQATGKSTFLRYLNPFGLEYYTESPLQNSKDTEFAFAENFIYNLEELSSLSNTDVNRLKSIISKSSIKERKPYAQDAEAHPRRCTFWGSTNRVEFLTDYQNTRWLCFTVEGLDWDYSKDIDINRVYSQALALYRSNEFNFELTAEEQEKRDFINKGFEVVDTEKELIMLHYKVTEKDRGEFVSNADILQDLTEFTDGKIRLNSRFLSKSMVQLGFNRDVRKANGHTVRGFWVKKVLNPDYRIDHEADLPLEEKIKAYKAKKDNKKIDGDQPPF